MTTINYKFTRFIVWQATTPAVSVLNLDGPRLTGMNHFVAKGHLFRGKVTLRSDKDDHILSGMYNFQEGPLPRFHNRQ